MPERDKTTLYFEDVSVGQEITPRVIPITVQRMVMEAGANRAFSPMHCDRQAARAAGAEDMFVNTMFIEMLFEVTLRSWMGLGGRLRRLGPFRIQKNICPGDVLTCGGRVKSKEEGEREGLVKVEIWQESERGVTSRGEASISLPRRQAPNSSAA